MTDQELKGLVQVRAGIENKRKQHRKEREKRHRLRYWIQQHTALALVLFIIMLLAPIVAVSGYAGNCLITYLRADRDAQNARDYWNDRIAPYAAEDRRIELRIYSQTASDEDYDRKREILAKMVALDRERAKSLEANPAPDFPTNLCGLIKIGGGS